MSYRSSCPRLLYVFRTMTTDQSGYEYYWICPSCCNVNLFGAITIQDPMPVLKIACSDCENLIALPYPTSHSSHPPTTVSDWRHHDTLFDPMSEEFQNHDLYKDIAIEKGKSFHFGIDAFYQKMIELIHVYRECCG